MERQPSAGELSKHVQKSIELDPEQRALLEKKIKEIETNFIQETKNADKLKSYLGEQRKNALLAEKIEEDELKRQGTSLLFMLQCIVLTYDTL